MPVHLTAAIHGLPSGRVLWRMARIILQVSVILLPAEVPATTTMASAGGCYEQGRRDL